MTLAPASPRVVDVVRNRRDVLVTTPDGVRWLVPNRACGWEDRVSLNGVIPLEPRPDAAAAREILALIGWPGAEAR